MSTTSFDEILTRVISPMIFLCGPVVFLVNHQFGQIRKNVFPRSNWCRAFANYIVNIFVSFPFIFFTYFISKLENYFIFRKVGSVIRFCLVGKLTTDKRIQTDGFHIESPRW